LCSSLWEPYLIYPFHIIHIVSQNFRNMRGIGILRNEKMCYSTVYGQMIWMFLIKVCCNISQAPLPNSLSDCLTGRRQRLVYFCTFDLPCMTYSMNDIFFCVLYNIFCTHHPAFSYRMQYFPLATIHFFCSYFGPCE